MNRPIFGHPVGHPVGVTNQCNSNFRSSFLCILRPTDSNPDQEYPEWYSFLMASWIFFGLAWLALVINHSIDILERLNGFFNRWWKRRHSKEETDPPDSENPDCAENPDTQVEQVEVEPVKQHPTDK